MIPQGLAASRLSVYYTETVVLPPAELGNMDELEKCDLGQKKRVKYDSIKHLHCLYLI